MNVKAKAGCKLLTNKRDKYRLNLLQRNDDSPALVLVHVNVVDGEETYKLIAELDMSSIYEQVFHVIEGV